ncbi:MAG: BsuPI-related putative proteinase inhibitor [bacterium]
MNTRLLITLLCAGAVALACGSLARNDKPAAPAATISKRSAVASPARSANASPVDGKFAVNVEPHALRFALDVTNQGKKKVELTFPSGQEYEFTVLDSMGREVYRWGSGRMFTQSVQNKLLGSGDTMRIDERAVTTLPQGKYIAVATMRSSNFPITQRSEFELR